MFIDLKERERERNINVREKHQWVFPTCALTRDQTHNLGMCPDQESNAQHSGARDDDAPMS